LSPTYRWSRKYNHIDFDSERFAFRWFHGTRPKFDELLKVNNSWNSFLFTVNIPRNSNGQRFVVINPSHAIYCHCSCDLTFWNEHDIDAANDCNANTDS
jgi:hypothetical protein